MNEGIATSGAAVVLFWLAGAVGACGARVVAEYQAGPAGNPAEAPSPAVSGWTALPPGQDLANFRSEAVSPDGASGYNAWRMLDNSTASGQFNYWNRPIAAADHGEAATNGWVLAARLRVADPVAGNAGNRSVALLYGNGSRRWGLFFDVAPDGTLVASFSSGTTSLRLEHLDAGDYHEHQLVHDPRTNTTHYLVNGAVVFSGYQGESNTFNGIRWGTGSSDGRGDGYWNQVSFVVSDGVAHAGGPRVTAHPASRVVADGGSLTLAAGFTGAAAFQWFKDAEALVGATGATHMIEVASPADAGDYWCRATGADGRSAATDTAVVAVLQAGAGLVISEFVASNDTGLRDADGDRGDWIEIFNADTAALSTAGWYLSDDPLVPDKWQFPDEEIPAGGMRVIHADGKDRRAAGGPLHTNFAISKAGGHLALRRPDLSPATVYDYPPQESDLGYGRSVHDPPRVGYFDPPSPGVLNRDVRRDARDALVFDPPGGMFEGTVAVSIAGGSGGGVLRVTTDGSRPAYDSPVHSGPLPLAGNTQLRAAVIHPGERHGASVTASYLRAGAGVAGFSSPLPLVVLSNFGAGEVPGVSSRGPRGDGGDVVRVAMQPQAFTILDQAAGPVTMASPAVHQSRAGLRRRGSSSFGFQVKSYKLDTWGELDGQNLNVGLLGLPEENDWVLYGPDAAQFDITLLHNSFTYELARRSGFNAPRFRFVELFADTNGDDRIDMADHRGLSILVESPKRDRARVPFDFLSADGSRGGWMVGIDRMDSLPAGSVPGSLAPRHFHTAGPDRILQTPDDNAIGTAVHDDQPNFYHSFFTFASPGGWDILPAQQAVVRDAVRALDAAIYSPDFRDPDAGYAPLIDMGNWAHHLAIQCLSRNQDAFVLSSYLYQESPGAPIRWATIWDFDRAYARMGSATANLDWAHNRLFYQRLVSDPEFRQVYTDTWQDLRRGAFATVAMHEIIDAQAAAISPAVAARSGVAATTWADRLNAMKSWLATRAAAIDALHVAPVAFSHPGGPAGPGVSLVMSAPAGTIYHTTDGSDPRARGGGPSATAMVDAGALAIDGPQVVTARAKVGDQWSGLTRAVFYSRSDGPRFLPGGSAAWTLAEHWESAPAAYPDGPGQLAVIGPPTTGDRNIDLLAPVTIGGIRFPHADSPFRNRLRGEAVAPALSFDGGGAAAARIEVGGSGGGGLVEFDLAGGVWLASQLELAVDHSGGDLTHGALRLRREWAGPGGLTKRGGGMASLTGGGKSYDGPTLVEEGVLQITGSSAPAATSVVSVFDGGQLRLVSAGHSVYRFGGDLVLRGGGRGGDSGGGRLGALRHDPPSAGHALIDAVIELAEPAGIHVAGSANLLEIGRDLRGGGSLRKSGGGTLLITGEHPGYVQPVDLTNGTLRLRGTLGSPVVVSGGALLDAAGAIGPLAGDGGLLLAGARLTAPAVHGLRHLLVFTGDGAGEPMLVTGEVRSPESIAIYLDFPTPPDPQQRVRGGYRLPAGASWAAILDRAAGNVYSPDPAGDHWFDGRAWSAHSAAAITRIPLEADPEDGSGGWVLEIRFDGAPLDYEGWRAATFAGSAEFADPAVSGPGAAPFADGMANLLRFALGIAGGDDVHGRLPTLQRSAEGVTFRFPYDPGLVGLRWTVEASRDPGDWSAAEVLFDSAARATQADADGWLGVPDRSAEPVRFYRLRVETRPE